MLEQSCEMIEDILIMPNDLQADVIVPIVNFMYTGTLEFHYNMYEKLLKTSREMNMTVLSKLLEAHRQTSGAVVRQSQPLLLNKNAVANRRVHQPETQITKIFKPLPTSQPPKAVVYKQGQTIIKQVGQNNSKIPEPIQIVTRYQQEKGSNRPSRFIVPDEVVLDSEATFESITYESKPLQTASQMKREDENSPFESLRKGYTNKRVASGSSQSPPSKKPNLDDIKAEAEAQRQRGEISADDEEAKEVDDDDDGRDFDADQYFEEEEVSDDEKGGSTIVRQTTKQITVNDCSGGQIDHAKILSEVLKKYPNLVKNPKNIKLKIMQKPSQSNSQQTTAIVRVMKQDNNQMSGRIVSSTPAYQRPTSSNQPKKIDAKTMHELIRLGAENMKGPWLCLECGSGGRPISIPTYKKFRAHLINVHKQKLDPRICEHCGLKPPRRIELIQHQLIQHNVNPPPDVPLFRCTTKSCIFVTQKEDVLIKHKREVHKEFQQKCKYCAKLFNKEFLLHAHMRAVHRHNAKHDGTMEYSEDEEYIPTGSGNSSKDESDAPSKKTNKIEILSNIEIPSTQSIKFEIDGTVTVASQPSSEADALNSVASGISTSIAIVDNIDDDQYNIEQQLAQVHGEFEEAKKEDQATITRLVAEDGTELELTASQKEEILQQLQSQGATLTDNVVMVLDQRQLSVDPNNDNIIIYSEAQEMSGIDSLTTTNVSTIKADELDSAEIVFQDDESLVKETPKQQQDAEVEKSKLISELEGDWTEEDESEKLDDIKEEPLSQVSEGQFSLIADEEEKTVEKKLEVNEKLKNIMEDWDDEQEASDEVEPSAEKEKEQSVESSKIKEEKKETKVVKEEVPEPTETKHIADESETAAKPSNDDEDDDGDDEEEEEDDEDEPENGEKHSPAATEGTSIKVGRGLKK